MPTIIDNLIVTLSLDPTKFTKAQKTAAEAVIKAKQEFGKSGRDIEGSAKSMTAFLERLRGQAIMMFAAFSGGKSVKQFFTDMVAGDAALGRMANRIGQTSAALSKWAGMARAMGGDAGSVTASIEALDRALVDISLMPTENPALLPYLRALGVSLQGANGHIKTATELLPELNKAVQGMDKRQASSILEKIGLTQDLINIVLQSTKDFNASMEAQERLGVVTKENTEKAMELQKSWAAVEQSFMSLGRVVLSAVQPYLVQTNDALTNLFVGLRKGTNEFKGHTDLLSKILYGLQLQMRMVGNAGDAAWKFINEGADKATKDIDAAWVSMLDGIGAKWKELWGSLSKTILDNAAPIYASVKKAFTEAFDWVIKTADTIWQAIYGTKLQEDKDAVDKKAAEAAGGPGGGSVAGGMAGPGIGGAGAGDMTPATRDQFNEDISEFMKLGWSREQATGIVANIKAESEGRIGAVGDAGQAYGLGQWHPDRQANFAKQFGHDIRQSTRDEQRRFYDWELRHTEAAAGNVLKTQTTAGGSARTVSTLFERPLLTGLEAAKRTGIAEDLYRNAPQYGQLPTTGAPAAAAASVANDNSRSHTNNADVKIGTINVNAPNATDASGVAGSIKPSLTDAMYAAQQQGGYQ